MLPIIIINLDDSIQRWESLSKQVAELGLSCTRFSATLGSALSVQEKQSWYDSAANTKRHHRNLTNGEIGCYVSHYRIWQKIVNENIPCCIVLEDDLTIDNAFPQVVDVIQSLDTNWDMIKLYDGRPTPFFESKQLDNEFTLGNYKEVPNGTQGYAITLEGARKLLKRKPFFRPVDVDIQFHSELSLNVLGIKPYKISVDQRFESDIIRINKGQHNNHSSALRNLKYRIKMFLERRKVSGRLPG